MTTSHGPRKRLPNNPSEENLRKQAKQLAKDEGLQLAAAQRRLAIEYGYRNWAELMRAVASRFVPLVPLRELIAFPHEVYPIFIGRRKSIRAIEAAKIRSRDLAGQLADFAGSSAGRDSRGTFSRRYVRGRHPGSHRRTGTPFRRYRENHGRRQEAGESHSLCVRSEVLQGAKLKRSRTPSADAGSGVGLSTATNATRRALIRFGATPRSSTKLRREIGRPSIGQKLTILLSFRT